MAQMGIINRIHFNTINNTCINGPHSGISFFFLKFVLKRAFLNCSQVCFYNDEYVHPCKINTWGSCS